MGDRTTASISVAARRADVMGVIADFAAYPEWASAVRSAEVIGRGQGGRASLVRFGLDAGLIKDSYVLSYDWDAVQFAADFDDGGYVLAEAGAGTRVTYDLAVDVRIPMPGVLKRRAEKTIIDTALKGLRDRAEAGRGDGT